MLSDDKRAMTYTSDTHRKKADVLMRLFQQQFVPAHQWRRFTEAHTEEGARSAWLRSTRRGRGGYRSPRAGQEYRAPRLRDRLRELRR